jgi:hypothetical protein
MISFDKTEFILTPIKYGDIKTITVNVFNNSSETVTLHTANSSCSCTTGSLKDTKLKPNSKTEFKISLSTLKAGKGLNQVKTIQLKYDLNRQQYSQVFRIKVDIV